MDNSSKRGIWSLTPKGTTAQISKAQAIQIIKDVQAQQSQKGSTDSNKDTQSDLENDSESEVIEVSDDLLTILQGLSPSGFERICQRLLREAGFKKVVVTGKSGDGGIDGEGILEINPLMSFKVLFQAKRYQGTVSSSTVRDFRGAMQGRADKGIIITTGRFSQEAKKEAIRDGAPPIELVDGDALVELFEKNELGVKPKVIYEIDKEFFKDFID